MKTRQLSDAGNRLAYFYLVHGVREKKLPHVRKTNHLVIDDCIDILILDERPFFVKQSDGFGRLLFQVVLHAPHDERKLLFQTLFLLPFLTIIHPLVKPHLNVVRLSVIYYFFHIKKGRRVFEKHFSRSLYFHSTDQFLLQYRVAYNNSKCLSLLLIKRDARVRP